ncbi:hypothetical protein [Oryza sativa Japonica Group]|uniref:Uncharacterized protein n=2 Tax=Oryza sativa subsp. japonica TaxID=39947 RepID=Q7F7M5_ORYSJ|nr:hypothetical protein [Oryza sativa Japonica Group]BAB16857.1 hypothetical protein [Oryza sativa Japonica Group]
MVDDTCAPPPIATRHLSLLSLSLQQQQRRNGIVGARKGSARTRGSHRCICRRVPVSALHAHLISGVRHQRRRRRPLCVDESYSGGRRTTATRALQLAKRRRHGRCRGVVRSYASATTQTILLPLLAHPFLSIWEDFNFSVILPPFRNV